MMVICRTAFTVVIVDTLSAHGHLGGAAGPFYVVSVPEIRTHIPDNVQPVVVSENGGLYL